MPNINLKGFYDAAIAATTAKTTKAVEIQKLFDAGATEKALEMKKDLDALTKSAKDAEEMYISMRDAAQGDDPAKKFTPANDRQKADEAKDADILKSNEYTNAFFKALSSSMTPKDFKKSGVPAGMEVLTKALTETGGTPAGADGGFLLPVDFNNMIIERQRQFLDLSQYVNVENVQAFSGWRAIEKAVASQPFTTFANNTPVPQAEQPAFEKITYQVRDYGGFLPVSNDLLEDTPTGIMTYLSNWFGKHVVLTNNSLILAILNALTEQTVDITNSKNAIDAIKKVLNVTLDPDISVNATIFVNQDGFDFLDQLKDNYGRPLLQPDPTSPTKYTLKGRPVALLANRLLPPTKGTETTPKDHSRIIVGDAKEAITLFARSGLEMVSTTIGGNAWYNNNTEIRGIMRADCQQTDDGAVAAIDLVLD
jgi:HK97 family phage major capsid protein